MRVFYRHRSPCPYEFALEPLSARMLHVEGPGYKDIGTRAGLNKPEAHLNKRARDTVAKLPRMLPPDIDRDREGRFKLVYPGNKRVYIVIRRDVLPEAHVPQAACKHFPCKPDAEELVCGM